MSASLVGSEMCIRDRAPVREQESRPEARQPRGRQALAPERARAARRAACLLYTSDAADDM
eukprot:11749395-Alexandrium_andersonii.AAC.1